MTHGTRTSIWGMPAMLIALVSGCAAPPSSAPTGPQSGSAPGAKAAAIRFQLASVAPVAEAREMVRPGGRKVYVLPTVALDNGDLAEVRALHSAERSMLQITLNALGAERLYSLTRGNRGRLVAIFVDDDLIAALPIEGPVAGGQVRVIEGMTRARAEKLAEALNRR